MKVIATHIKDLMVIEPRVFGDSRGYFFESFNDANFQSKGLDFDFIQDNEAFSSFGVLRGLHYQKPPFAQTKLIRSIQGKILDVVLDLRKSSETYGQTFSIVLDDNEKKQLLVPKGFAHGYVVLSETAIVAYKVDAPYMPSEEDGILWNDQKLMIDWMVSPLDVKLSEKDKILQTFENFNSPFE